MPPLEQCFVFGYLIEFIVSPLDGVGFVLISVYSASVKGELSVKCQVS